MSQLLKRKLRPACININQVEDESTSRNCQIHYTLKLDDLYEVNASIKGSASTCLNSIVTIIRSSDSGTEVKVLFRIPNKKTSFVNFNFPAVKLNKLNVLDLQILADIQESQQNGSTEKILKRHIEIPSSDYTTHVAVMFVINIQKEMVRGIHQVEQKVNYFYASGSMNERLLKSLTEQLCLQNSEQGPLMSPTLSIPRHLFALVAQNHGNELTLYTGHRSVQMALHYELLLDDHYIAETKCQFDCASDDAVMSVITCLDISSSGTVAEIILKKKNNQVSFVRYTFHELNAKEFKTLNLKLSYAPCSGVNIGICLEKYLVLPRTKHTSKINLALMFDLIKPNELEPKVIYIFLKDCIHLQDTNTSSDDCSSNNPNTDHGQSNSAQTKSQNEIHQHCTPSQPNVLDIQETCKENIPQTDQPLQEPVSSQESKKDHETKIKPVTVELNPHDPLISMLMPSTDKTSTVAPEKTGFKFDSAALATAVRDTVCRFFKDSCSVDFFNFCTSASPSLSKEATDSGLNVNVIQINNIITCNMDHVTNAVVGGQLYNTVIHKNTEADME